jgi:hypothetical protein
MIDTPSEDRTMSESREKDSEKVFSPHWPKGLESMKAYQFQCDDKGRDGTQFRAVQCSPLTVHMPVVIEVSKETP